MSGLDFITTARALRTMWPAVIISGFADLDDIAKRPADVPLVAKPFTSAALLQAIRNVLTPRMNEPKSEFRLDISRT
jgi:hypothetical protein